MNPESPEPPPLPSEQEEPPPKVPFGFQVWLGLFAVILLGTIVVFAKAPQFSGFVVAMLPLIAIACCCIRPVRGFGVGLLLGFGLALLLLFSLCVAGVANL